MDDRLENEIVALLEKLGYKNVSSSFGTIYYETKDGESWTIMATLAE